MEEYSDRTPADVAWYPMVPIRDVVIFPFTKVAFKIGRSGSVRALEQALATDRTIFLATQHDATVDEPSPGTDLRRSERSAAFSSRKNRRTARSKS